jgi:subtilisin family serine protease
LITGDRVLLGAGGQVRVEPARRMGVTRGGFLKHVGPDGVSIIPAAAAPLVAKGRLDRELFNVTGLIRQGYDDAHTAELPLLVNAQGVGVAGHGRVTRELPGLSAISVAKAKAAVFFDSLTTGVMAQGEHKIWLNGKASLALNESVRQVGAPAAWEAGHTGAGATIAVLDSGYDAKHPDFAGVVTQSRGFVGEPDDVRDVVGHGTHVASTIAGRGTASGGKYTGVAKGARLMIGKVCGDDSCRFDAVIAGMRWAAEGGAKVVNMSFGGFPTDGTDPLSTELNRISAQYGTLFVVAAGNSGSPKSVGTPATADSALAVASVTKQDTMSPFSSRGPRAGDFGIKPEIAAPGQDIVAARADGTLEDRVVDQHYARLSGTSMAAPHVAGAAGILAAQHPDWTGEQLKAALMSTSNPISAGLYDQGAGRLDVARAVSQRVAVSPASLGFGFLRWPQTGPVEGKRVTYRNFGTAPVTLRLSFDVRDGSGAQAPAGMFRGDRQEVTIAAGGEAAVTVTIDQTAGPAETYGGRLVATGTDGAVVVRTPVGLIKEPESYDLKLRVLDRTGAEVDQESTRSAIRITDRDDPGGSFVDARSGDTVRLVAGRRYVAMGGVHTPIPGQLEPALTLFAELDLVVRKETTLTFDARRGKRVNIAVEERDARLLDGMTGMMLRSAKSENGFVTGQTTELYAVPTTGALQDFLYYNRSQLEKPVVRMTVTKPESFEVPTYLAPGSPAIVGEHQFGAIDVGHARPEDIAGKDLRGKLAVFTLDAGEGAEFDARVVALRDAGAAVAMFYFSEPVEIFVETPPIPTVFTFTPEGPRLAKVAAGGNAAVTVNWIVASPYRYDLALPHLGGIPAKVDHRPSNRDLAKVSARYHALVDGTIGFTNQDSRFNGFFIDEAIFSKRIPVPLERTEYYSPGPVSWGMTADFGQTDNLTQGGVADRRTFRPGEQATINWNKSMFGPSLSTPLERFGQQPTAQVSRAGDTIVAQMALLSDSGGNDAFPRPLPEEQGGYGDTGDTALYADGRLVGRSGVPGDGRFTVPAQPANYRLVSEVNRNHPTWPLSTKVSLEWTFRSGHTDRPSALPLLTIGADPRTDMNNFAPARKRFMFPVKVDRQPGASGRAPVLRSVEVSHDDGATWQRARLCKAGGTWLAIVDQPAAGFVSLRASAADPDGNTVQQTTIRAYRTR